MSVTASVEDRVGWITLDRPPANSYDPAFLEELQTELEQLAPLFSSDDAREGMMAFTEKRPPKYAGR
jgi:enoyl-CoA hydratase/carnithine racemase